LNNAVKVGIDAGGTLIKIAYMDQNEPKFRKLPTTQMTAAADWIRRSFPHAEICMTGGKGTLLQSHLPGKVRTMVEFDATCSGVQYLMGKRGLRAETFVLTNAGTGTSIHFVDESGNRRLGGTGVGGGTLIGLSYLLTGIHDYNEIVSLSKQGKRNLIDLKVSDIYEGAVPPIPGDLTASNFGNVLHRFPGDQQPADLLACVSGLVGETVATASVLAAAQCGVSSVMYIGSSFIGNETLKEVVIGYTKLRGADPVILDNGEYSGAIGALMSL
jgi:type II pantothenate kinase